MKDLYHVYHFESSRRTMHSLFVPNEVLVRKYEASFPNEDLPEFTICSVIVFIIAAPWLHKLLEVYYD